MTTGFVKNLLTLRRMEFFIVEITIFSIPVFFVARSVHEFRTAVFLEGALLFFILYSLGDMINCLYDRELDRTYKKRLSSAVYGLGVRFVRNLVIAEIILSLLLGIHLAYVARNWPIFLLVLFGIFLGVQYSAGPIHFKSRGILHVVCLWLLLFFLPMLYASLLVKETLTLPVIILAASYATIEMGIILINTAEDLLEDIAMGIRTTTVALGLERSVRLSANMVLLGGAAFTTIWAAFYYRTGMTTWYYVAPFSLAGACVYVYAMISRLHRRISTSDCSDQAIREVKKKGALVPVWATIVGLMGTICGIVYFAFKP